MLLAPTVQHVWRAMLKPAPHPGHMLPGNNLDHVHVFHAMVDPFCPKKQHSIFEEAGCQMHLHHDSHMLSTQPTVMDILTSTCLVTGVTEIQERQEEDEDHY